MSGTKTLKPIAVALIGALLAAASVAAGATSAWAASSVTVTNADGTATADPDYATTVTVSGSGFQSIQNGFGGVYVLFGWVDDPSGGSWRPSAGGAVGADYRYVPDSESKDNAGFQRFVAFPGSETASAAHAVMSGDGSWTVDMVIPGAVFESRDRNGDDTSVDCRRSTCGIITIGAHGVKNANNETFTRIAFAAPTAGTATRSDASPTAAPELGALRVGLASGSVDAGTSIAFTGQGFTPGEQVVATLDDGYVSVGPLAAGAHGEVAGVLPVPRDARGGTHLVTLTGAASGGVAETEVAIVAVTTDAAASATPETPMWFFVVLVCSVALALVLIVVSLIVSLVRFVRRRRARGATDASALTEATAPSRDDAEQPPAPPASAQSPSDASPDAETVELPIGAGARS